MKFSFGLIVFFILTFELSAQGSIKFTYANKNYEIVKEYLNWVDAANYAKSKGGYLTHIETIEEQTEIYNAILTSGISPHYATVLDGGGSSYIWIGATDMKAENVWIWDGDNDGVGSTFWTFQGLAGAGNGSVINNSYVNWGGATSKVFNEPDDFQNNQDCAAISLDFWTKNSKVIGLEGEWNDLNQSNQLYFIIEYDEKVDTPKLISPEDSSKNIGFYPTFNWSNVDADSYHFQISTKMDFAYYLIENKESIKNNYYTMFSNLIEGEKYYWRIRAKKNDSYSAWSKAFSFSTINPNYPFPPIPLKPIKSAIKVDLSPTFSWKIQHSDTTIFQLSEKSDFSVLLLNIKTLDTIYKITDKLKEGTIYYWRLQGIIGRNKSEWWSSSFTTYSKLKVPELIYPEDNGIIEDSTLINFKFDVDDSISNLRFIISDSPNFRYFILDSSIASSKISNFTPNIYFDNNSDYYWKISTTNSLGYNEISVSNKFTTKYKLPSFDKLIIKPNPTKDKLIIQSDKLIKNLLFFDVFGNQCSNIQIIKISEYECELLLSNLAIGIYIINLDGTNLKFMIGD